ncbi:MAG: sigma-54-dependent Fis family transcriptional regulator [Rikenellaceae bacterium]|nr:sigma-54-dependent Fis family transcriptional regulator [Rikenellaceae bacterium]
MAKVLILEQSKSMRNTLRERLEFEGFATAVAERGDVSESVVARRGYDAILAGSQAEDLASLGVPFIIVTSDGSIDEAVSAVKCGAEDYITAPVDMNRLLGSLRRIVEREQTVVQPQLSPARRRRATTTSEQIIGSSPAIEHVRCLIDKVAPSDARVLITGENGTGKELVARSLHDKSARAGAPFVEVNCAAIPSELIESELFGHERGAFTSAIKQRRGKFEQANGGTLFMDEIGDMSLSAQAKVLRALQENKISRVGSDKDVSVDVRVVAATNKDIRAEIARGNFREDLYHRLSVILIKVPPLRERAGDITELVDYFVGQIASEHNISPKRVEAEAKRALSAMPWSGNIRELRNVVERLMILSGDVVTAEDVRMYC